MGFKVVNEASGRRASNGNRSQSTFQYEVQGRKLVGGTKSDHAGSYSSELSDWIQYQPGRHQQIRYNPAQPQEITIEDLSQVISRATKVGQLGHRADSDRVGSQKVIVVF
jgi:Protein of unknown function (DUF3592)